MEATPEEHKFVAHKAQTHGSANPHTTVRGNNIDRLLRQAAVSQYAAITYNVCMFSLSFPFYLEINL
jgi:hypothetical protein